LRRRSRTEIKNNQISDYFLWEITKCNPRTAMDRPWGLREVEAPRFISPTPRPHLPRRKYPWYSFLLEAGSTPGSWCGRRTMSKTDTIGNKTCDLPTCSAVHKPTAPSSYAITEFYLPVSLQKTCVCDTPQFRATKCECHRLRSKSLCTDRTQQ